MDGAAFKGLRVPIGIWPMLAFMLPLALYLSTLAPSVTFYDSGEFLTAVHFLGSAHSPGYPLFLLYAKPFTWLPIGSLAFRVNVATAVSAALACLTVFVLVRQLLHKSSFCEDRKLTDFVHNLTALSGALLFAVSPRLWLQSNHDKPYPLLSALVAFAFWCLLRWRDESDNGVGHPAWLYAVGFIAGLATGAHQTIVLLIPAWILFVVLVDGSWLVRFREICLTIAFSVAGGAIQLYLPLRAAADARQNWGDASAWSRFLWHVLRRGYPEEPHGRDIALLLKQLSGFSIPNEFGWIGLVLLLLGATACWKAHRPFVLASATALCCFWAMLAGYFNPQADAIFLTEEFYTPLYLLGAVFVAIGLYAVAAWGVTAAEKAERYTAGHAALLAIFLLLVPLGYLATRYADNNQQRNYIGHDYAVNTLRQLPEHAVLFTWGDSGAFPLWYLQGVERLREDVDLPHIPHLGFAWYRRELPRLQISAYGQAIPGEMPESIFLRLAGGLQAGRPVLMDYSTRHSINWGPREPMREGMLFQVPMLNGEKQAIDDSVWQYYVFHRYARYGSWLLDQDSEKAVMIAAHTMLQTVEHPADGMEKKRLAGLLCDVEQLVPAWKPTVEQLQRRYEFPACSRNRKE